MRGRASGLGARISSMVGLLITLDHRTDHLFDKRDLLDCKLVFLIESGVSPRAIPSLLRNPCINRLSRMLSDLAEREEKPEKSGSCVARDGLCFGFGVRIHEY